MSQESRTNPAECPRSLVVERVSRTRRRSFGERLPRAHCSRNGRTDNDFEPVVGRKFQFRADPMPNWNGIVDCEVLVVEPLQRLVYNWGVGDVASGLQWVVLWTLTAAEGGTHVRMEQSGFGPDQQAAYQGANYGGNFFTGLERVLGGSAS